jgi:excinuclease UvrABC ATPase subunit
VLLRPYSLRDKKVVVCVFNAVFVHHSDYIIDIVPEGGKAVGKVVIKELQKEIE